VQRSVPYNGIEISRPLHRVGFIELLCGRIVQRSVPYNGWLHPLGGCGVSTIATELTGMRVEQLKSREIAQSGASRG